MSNNSSETYFTLLQEKLAAFRREHTITADPSRKFQLKKEIEEIERQIQEFEKNLKNSKHHTRENLPDKSLESALCKLNHSDQCTDFKYLTNICNNLIGVRIQTSSKNNFPLVWLLRSLIKNLENDEVICARLTLDSHRYRSGNFQLILEGISEGLKLSEHHRNSTVKDIIYKIRNKILHEEQHIILLLYGVDSQKKSVMEKILKDFWVPLITEIKTNKNNNNHLLMFWIDYKKSTDWRESYIFPNNPDDSRLKSADTLFNICVTSKFTQKELKNWLEGQDGRSALTIFDYNLVKKENISATFKKIWDESQKGKPELVLKVLYKLCNLEWENYESRWLDF